MRAERHARAGHAHRHHHTNTTTAITTNTTPTTTTAITTNTTPTSTPATTATTTATTTTATPTSPPPAPANDPAWLGNTPTQGTATAPTSGSWSISGTNTNWSPNGTPANSAALSFGGSGSSSYTSTNNITTYIVGAVSLTSTSTATDIIGGNQFQIGGTLNPTSISQDNTGAFTIQNAFDNTTTNASTTLTLTGNGTGLVTLSGIISEKTSSKNVSLTKTGTSTFVLSGANTYTGATTVSAGILNIQNATALGATTAGTSVASSATLQIQGGITVGAEALTISGTGATGQNGALVNVSGTNNYGGLVTLGAASTISSDSGTLNLTNTGNITGATFGLTLTGAGNGSVSSNINTTTGTLTKNGAGTWTLTGASTYSGGTSVTAGKLFVNNTSGSGTGTGTITVTGSGTTLGGNGTMTGAVSVASGNNLAPGASGVGSTAILTTGAVTLSSGSNFQIDINGTTVGSGYDQLKANGASIAGSNLLLTLGTTFTQSDVGDKFAILSNVSASLVTGTFSGLSEGASFNDGNDKFMITYVGNAGDGTDGNDIVLTLTAVPEPSTWFAGGLALAMLLYIQLRKRSPATVAAATRTGRPSRRHRCRL